MYIINFNQIKCMWIKWTIFGTIPYLLSEEKNDENAMSNQQSNTPGYCPRKKKNIHKKEELVSTHRALNTAPRYESNRTLQGWLQNTAWCPEPVSVLIQWKSGFSQKWSHQPAKSPHLTHWRRAVSRYASCLQWVKLSWFICLLKYSFIFMRQTLKLTTHGYTCEMPLSSTEYAYTWTTLHKV